LKSQTAGLSYVYTNPNHCDLPEYQINIESNLQGNKGCGLRLPRSQEPLPNRLKPDWCTHATATNHPSRVWPLPVRWRGE